MEYNKIQTICMISLFTAVITILAQFSIPLPFGVPLSLQSSAVILSTMLLGKRNGTLCVIIYLVLGAIGLPVFANFRGGLQAFVSPTGGFLLGYPFMGYIISLGFDKNTNSVQFCNVRFLFFFILGHAVHYLFGLTVFCMITATNTTTGILTCILPFLPTDLLKAILTYILGTHLKKKLNLMQI